MFNATNLLGSLLQNRSTPSAGGRLGNLLGQGGGQSGGALGGLLAQFGGGRQGGGGQSGGGQGGGGQGGGGQGGGLLDSLMGAFRPGDAGADSQRVGNLARSAMASPGRELANNNPLAVGGLGALAGTLLGGGRGAVGGGLLAVLGSLAYDALRSGGQATPAPAAATSSTGDYARPGTLAAMTPEDVEYTARLVLRSMIQAAKADGHIDAAEIERITGKIAEGDPAEAAEAQAYVFEQMRGPADIAGLVRDIRSPAEAAQAYGAALMAIEADTPAERDYLARLARELGLQPATVGHLHSSLGVPPPV